MSKVITQNLENAILHTFSLANEFLKVCPGNVWSRKFGRWPVWQQLYHAFVAMDFFVRPMDAPVESGPVSGDVGNLKVVAEEAPDMKLVREYVENSQARVREYIAGLNDAVLSDKNEGLSARMGKETSHAFTLCLLASHTMYHLGSCDAALREEGIPGVF